jgi:TRAP-type C4-dicarboxylate transport system substrate-binding protein
VQETYPAGQLAEKQASLEGLKLGTIELCELAATDFAQFDDIWDVFALPYLFDSGLQAVQVMQDPDVRAITDQSAADMGYVILSWWNFGERNVINTKHAINTPDDLKGIKIRVMQSASL